MTRLYRDRYEFTVVHLTYGRVLTSQQQKKIRHVAPDPDDEESGGSVPLPPSPPRYTASQKQKAREVQEQSTLGYRKRPGPNKQAHATRHRLQIAPLVPKQHRATQQRDGGSSTSRRPRGTIERFWTQIAKVYGMMYSPWVLESVLRQALHCRPGEGDSEDDGVHELVEFLDEAEISDDDRRHPRFCVNVSPVVQLPI